MKNTPTDDILSDSPMLLRKTRLWWSSWIKSLDIANQVACHEFYTWKWHSVNERSFGKIASDVVTNFLEEDI